MSLDREESGTGAAAPEDSPEIGRALREAAMAFAEIGELLIGLPTTTTVFERVTELVVDRIRGAEFAGITRQTGDTLETIAPTDPLVRAVDRIQYELRSGPCVDALEDERAYVSEDITSDPRWSEFGARAHGDSGISSMMSFRLFLEDLPEEAFALNVYSRERDAFDEHGEAEGYLLATHCALAAAAAANRDRSVNLEIALTTAREIGIAIGVLMYATKITRDQAFDLLRVVSQRTQRKLADIAAEVAGTGALPSLPVRRRPPRRA